jgi:hypothetical protein
MDAKVSTKTKTLPVQNLFRYIGFLFAKTCICKIKKIYGVERNSENYKKCHKSIGMTTKSKEDVKMYTKYSKSVKR